MKALILATTLAATAAFADDAAKPAEAAAKPAAAAAKPKKAMAPMEIPAADVKWGEMKDSGGIMFAALTGDSSKGPFTAFVKFPAGMMQPQHTHTANVKVVVISGTLMGGADAASAKEFAPGSFRLVPSGWKHMTGCKAGADCVVFIDASAKFDQVPTEAPKAEEAKK
jgi:anti-sigma factor ChrR (cupin superfamily)